MVEFNINIHPFKLVLSKCTHSFFELIWNIQRAKNKPIDTAAFRLLPVVADLWHVTTSAAKPNHAG